VTLIIVPVDDLVVVISSRALSSTTCMLRRSGLRLITLHETTTVSGGTVGNATSFFGSFCEQLDSSIVTQSIQFRIPRTRSRLPRKVHRVHPTPSAP
jgi:hypothetical protein